MRPVSATFLAAIRGSHKMFARVRVCTEFQSGIDPDGTEITIVDGNVSMNANANIRSSVDVRTDGNRMFPQSIVGLLTPYGNELFVERGIRLPDGTTEIVSLGYHRINDVEQSQAPNGPIQITGYDRMAGIIDAKLVAPLVWPAGTAIGDIFDFMVTDVYPTATIEFDDAGFASTVLPTQQMAESDRYKFLNDIAKSYGKIMYWDYRGVLVVEDPPDPQESVWSVNAGQGGVLISMARALNREGVFNAVVVRGESTNANAPVRALAFDNDVNSPTYYFGPFGKVPTFYSSSLVTTEEQALVAAQAILKQTIGLPQFADFTAVPNPALEPLDIVEINHVDGIDFHVIESLNVPLVAQQPQNGTTRKRASLVLGT